LRAFVPSRYRYGTIVEKYLKYI